MAAEPDVDESALRGLIRLSRQVETVLVEFNLSPSQYRVLDRLAGGQAAGKSLAEWLAVRPPTVTALVDGLAARGLVRRIPDEDDRRRVTHELTTEGYATYQAISAGLEARLRHVAVNATTDAEARRMIAALGAWDRALARTSLRSQTRSAPWR